MKFSLLKIALALALCVPLAEAQTYTRAALWQKEIDAFAEIDRKQTPPRDAVLFVGSSSIRLWRSMSEDFPQIAFINRGFGGSQLEDVNFYFERLVAPYKPKKIVLYAGENDITEGKSTETVLADFKNFVRLVREKSPGSKIFFVSLKPSPSRWHLREKLQTANQLIKAECEKSRQATFIDVWAAMLGASGEPRDELFINDKLHMNEKGYIIWREILSKHLK